MEHTEKQIKKNGDTKRTWDERFLTALEYFMAIGLLIMAGTVVLQVVLSSCFNSSITGANELIAKLFVYVTAIGAAVAIGKDEHISITFFAESLRPVAQRWLNVLALFAVALINVVIIAYSFHWISVTGDYLIPPTPLPRIVAQLAVPVGSTLAVLFCATRCVSLLATSTDNTPSITTIPRQQTDTTEPSP